MLFLLRQGWGTVVKTSVQQSGR